jgi:hypothetical protein
MSGIVNKQLTDTEEILITRHSERTEPLKAAFRAHSLKEYFLSIPVFLAQADGISKKIANSYIFNKPEKLKNWVANTPKEEIHKIICSALLEIDNGKFHMKYRNSNFTKEISRHAILHGDDYTYGIEVNSLKAISLLRYISDVISPREVHGYTE